MYSRIATPILVLVSLLVVAPRVTAAPNEFKEQAEAGTSSSSDSDGQTHDPTDNSALGSTAAGTSPYQPLTGKERWHLYLKNAYWSPMSLGRSAGAALGAQLTNEPPEWGQGMEGFGQRFADRAGRFAVQESYQALGAALLQHEVRYIPSRKSAFLPRFAYALAANFVTYNRNGRRTPHVTRLGAMVGAEFTADLWQPEDRVSDVFRGVGVQLGTSSAFNLLREFGPEVKRLFRRK
ncbi:MAG: hypothetical protein ABL967_00385 [Bryobacteraceae bacterium]